MGRAGRPSPRSILRIAAPAAYAAGLGVAIALDRLPVARDWLLLWIVGGLVAFSVSDLRRLGRGLVVDWLPFILVLLAYDFLRGHADGLLPVHVRPQIDLERALFGGEVPTVWLQQRLWDGARHIHWWDYLTWFVYLTHFFGTLVVAAVLWLRAPERFRRYVAMVTALAALGFATYVLLPAAPPWMASRDGELEATHRMIGTVWRSVPIAHFNVLFEKGGHYANDVAAVPSLHAAYSLLIALFLWRSVRWPWRVLLAAYPPAMAFALVYSAEHYVVDVLLGWIYAAVVFVAVERAASALERRRSARREAGVELAA
jgi:membrane-associated phospholipid phosphatase